LAARAARHHWSRDRAPGYDDFAKRNGMGMNDDPQRKTPGGITGKGFVKGDSRINRKGRPRSFDEFRHVAQKIAGEDVVGADGNTITRAEQLLRSWARSKKPMLQKLLIEFAYGKVPDKIATNEL
jgi:hypothetical protein